VVTVQHRHTAPSDHPALPGGKAIFVEKPVDLALERARAGVDAVARAGVLCMIGFQRRFDPTFSALKQRLDAGEIGSPEMLIVTSRDPGPPPVSYIKVSGGIFKDMLIHTSTSFAGCWRTRPRLCTRPAAAWSIPRSARRATSIPLP
jgi:predicted dehydrogenase